MCFKRKQQQNQQGKHFVSSSLPLCTTEEWSVHNCGSLCSLWHWTSSRGTLGSCFWRQPKASLCLAVLIISSLSRTLKAWAFWVETRIMETWAPNSTGSVGLWIETLGHKIWPKNQWCLRHNKVFSVLASSRKARHGNCLCVMRNFYKITWLTSGWPLSVVTVSSSFPGGFAYMARLLGVHCFWKQERSTNSGHTLTVQPMCLFCVVSYSMFSALC